MQGLYGEDRKGENLGVQISGSMEFLHWMSLEISKEETKWDFKCYLNTSGWKKAKVSVETRGDSGFSSGQSGCNYSQPSPRLHSCTTPRTWGSGKRFHGGRVWAQQWLGSCHLFDDSIRLKARVCSLMRTSGLVLP